MPGLQQGAEAMGGGDHLVRVEQAIRERPQATCGVGHRPCVQRQRFCAQATDQFSTYGHRPARCIRPQACSTHGHRQGVCVGTGRFWAERPQATCGVSHRARVEAAIPDAGRVCGDAERPNAMGGCGHLVRVEQARRERAQGTCGVGHRLVASDSVCAPFFLGRRTLIKEMET